MLHPHPSKDSIQRSGLTRKVHLSLNLRNKFFLEEEFGSASSNSTNILSPSYRGRYRPARLCKIISTESHRGKSTPAGPKSGIFLSRTNDTFESWALVTVERHFSINLHGPAGRLWPNGSLIVRGWDNTREKAHRTLHLGLT